MAREGLRETLPGAFRKALQSFTPITIHNIKMGTNGGTRFVDIIVQRIEKPDQLRGMVMVIFSDAQLIYNEDAASSSNKKQSTPSRYKELETELQRNCEDLQSTREEMQASHEELKSANEELQSTNEELQSTNEELTTSKEEMQSLNEELQTVNAELQSKISDFVKADSDMRNLLNSTEIATLFLDRKLNIRRFTESITGVIKLRITDIGRPFTDLVSNLQFPEIEENALQVLKSLTTFEKAIETYDKRWFNVRIMPYRTIEDHIDGLVMTFSDITIAKQLEIELKEANDALLKNQVKK
jgi:two-component system CheB/CheR fusion protein